MKIPGKNLWIGTAGGGLNLYNRNSDSFTRYSHDSLSTSDIGSNYISAIAEDKKGYLWLASPEGILTRYDAATHKGECFNLSGNNVTDRQTTHSDNYSLIQKTMYGLPRKSDFIITTSRKKNSPILLRDPPISI